MTIGALFDAVYAAPDDDDVRQALAQFLSQTGDPRGEFIAAQLEGSTRADALLSDHEELWLGPLAEVLDPESVTHPRYL